MKNRLLLYLIISGIIALSISCKSKIKAQANTTVTNIFTADSGYILKPHGVALLLQITNNNSVNISEKYFKDNDTIGKYYKTKTGNYIAYVLDIIHPEENWAPILFEYSTDGKIVAHEKYEDGMHLCCWKSNYDGLKKQGDYYSIKTCGTGSGFCAGYIYLFKNVEPQPLNGIPVTAWSSFCSFQAEDKPALACSLTSTITNISNDVTMHYKLEHLEPDDSDDVNYNPVDTEYFDIKYTKNETGWVTQDTTNFNKIPQ